MATVYSLICWGGRTGKTVSISASTDVVTLTNHGLWNGTKLWPSGTLPAELGSATPVYARSTAANTFTLHTSKSSAIAGTDQITFAGASTYAAVVLKSDLVASPSTALSAYGLSDLSRWGEPGSERIYDGINSWKTARAAVTSTLTTEVAEIAEGFTEIFGGTTNINLACAAVFITTSVNSIRSSAWNKGIYDPAVSLGYRLLGNGAGGGLYASTENTEFNGFVVEPVVSNGVTLAGTNSVARNMVVRGNGSGNGFFMNSAGAKAYGCIAKGFNKGFIVTSFTSSIVVANCLATGNATGFGNDGSSSRGRYYNNISVGNTTNWMASTLNADPLVSSASNNAGLSGEAWMTAGGSRITIATSDFIDSANNDWRPALSSSPQVDAGVSHYGVISSDITDSEVPNYNNGGYESVDVGPYEYDHGYGPHPASTTVIFDGVVAGSEIHIYDSAGNELIGVESCTANQALTWGIPANPVVVITIIKRGLRWQKFSYTSKVGDQSIPIFQNTDLGYNNPT